MIEHSTVFHTDVFHISVMGVILSKESRGVVITMKWCARAEGFAKAFEQFTEEGDLFASVM